LFEEFTTRTIRHGNLQAASDGPKSRPSRKKGKNRLADDSKHNGLSIWLQSEIDKGEKGTRASFAVAFPEPPAMAA
jgi:hypothetical protein